MTTDTHDYDIVILGGGSAGYAAARTALDEGLKTAVIDGAKELGGLCILRGCMPSKALIESANRARVIREASKFGLNAENFAADGQAIRARKRVLIQDFAGYRRGQLEAGRFDLIRGHATFTDPHTVKVFLLDGGERSVSFGSAVIATGSYITVPPIEGLEETGYLTSDDVLDGSNIPKSIIVLGGGAIALELAHYYEGLGVETTIVQRSEHILKETDSDVAEVIEQATRDRGVTLYTGTSLMNVSKTSDGRKRVTFDTCDGVVTVEAEEILAALGRNPATAKLALHDIGIDTQKRTGHIIVTLKQNTAAHPHIFACGDVTGPLEIVHLAIEQGEIAARNAAKLIINTSTAQMENFSTALKVFAVFTHPQIGMVGLTEKEAKEQNIPYIAASYPFNDHGKSMVMGETEGFVKLLAHKQTGLLIGAAVVGPHASDLIHEIVVAMNFQATAAQFAKIPHYHPTLSEIWTYPAEELSEEIATNNPNS